MTYGLSSVVFDRCYAADVVSLTMAIADEVRALRARLGEDTATFGARWHKSGRTVEGWEQARRQPDAHVLAEMRQLAARKRITLKRE
jgi:DNA-binding transcriptional regulator YiaG